MNVCIFCGSSTGSNPIYRQAAVELATLLSESKCTLVYGGGNIGIMGVIADEMIRNSSGVIGIIPDFLVQREVAHKGLSELIIVETMHDRKKRMADLADVFIVLPGGMGTLDETAEILTWKQLGLTKSPLGILNTNGFFDPLLAQFKKMVEDGFMDVANIDAIKIHAEPKKLLTSLGVVPA